MQNCFLNSFDGFRKESGMLKIEGAFLKAAFGIIFSSSNISATAIWMTSESAKKMCISYRPFQ